MWHPAASWTQDPPVREFVAALRPCGQRGMVEAIRRHQRVTASGVRRPQSERLRRRQRWYFALMGVCLVADPAGLEPGPLVVDDGSRGHDGGRCGAPTDRRGHRQLGRRPLTTRRGRHMPGRRPGTTRPAPGLWTRCSLRFGIRN